MLLFFFSQSQSAKENIQMPMHQMGFVHSTQIQNKSHPHPHLPDAITDTGFAPIRCCCNLPSKAPSSKRLPSGHNHLSVH